MDRAMSRASVEFAVRGVPKRSASLATVPPLI